MPTFVIVGAGQAAAVAARALRRRGFDGRVEIIGDEPHRPYQRPPLSKGYLAGGGDDGLFLLPEQWCDSNDVHLRLGTRAVAVHARRCAVELDDGTEVDADAVLIATGSSPRRLPGFDGERICYLRTVDDADRLRAGLLRGSRLIVIGAGFVGAEVAATARRLGADVTVIEALDVPMQRILGARVGGVCARLHEANGVELRLGESVESVAETADGIAVTTSRGSVEGDLVVVGVGVRPNVDVAQKSGIAVENGILVDEYCRTSVPNVYAAGDVANHPGYGERIRVEHFDNASRQAAVAAQNMLGRTVAYAEPHWFWSDQYGMNMQYTGHASSTDELVVRGSIDDLDFCAFYLRNGLIRAAFAIERGADVLATRELVGRAFDPDTLMDEDVDPAELATLEQA